MDILFAIRGLLSFVAFTEFTTAIRCVLPVAAAEESYVEAKLFSAVDLGGDAGRTVRHTYAAYSLLVGLAVVHAAVYAHYRPVVGLAICALATKLLFLVAEAAVFGSIPAGQPLIFPVVSAAGSIAALLAVPLVTSPGSRLLADDENAELAKRMPVARPTKKKAS